MSAVPVPSFGVAALGSAAHALLVEVGRRAPVSRRMDSENDSELLAHITTLALEAGFVVESVQFFAGDAKRLLDRGVPFLFVPQPDSREVFAVATGGRQPRVLAPEGGLRSIPRTSLEERLVSPAARRFEAVAESLGSSLPDLDPRGLSRALEEELGASLPIGWGFVFRPNVAESVARVRQALGLVPRVLGFLGISLAEAGISLAAWALIGSLSMSGRVDRGRLLGWALLSLTVVLIQVLALRKLGAFTVRVAALVRQRLLQGALGLQPDSLNRFGLGGLMVVASQADSFLNLVLTLLLSALGVLTNVVATVMVLDASPARIHAMVILGVTLLLVALATPRLLRLKREEQHARMRLTTDMIERMLGHRTRLVQQTPSSLHEGEDEVLLGYGESAERVDRFVGLLGLLPRTYYAISLVAIFSVLVGSPSQEALALSLGGIALGSMTVSAIAHLATSTGDLFALWGSVEPFVKQKDEALRLTSAASTESRDRDAKAGPVIELAGVSFTYPGRKKSVFEDLNVQVCPGDRVLVEGRSGGGKTTLAALLTGLHKPTSGLVFVRGLDQHTIGERDLRRVVASAPQFYKNHIFTESLAFNLLVGRAWPPTRDDLAEAMRVVKELGLEAMVARMPQGIFQHVGETGWQLSHGERSRVFLARTLLQRSEVVVLDETFGALDPSTLERCMEVVLARARSLVVITHR